MQVIIFETFKFLKQTSFEGDCFGENSNLPKQKLA
jgi:hypothetical protein